MDTALPRQPLQARRHPQRRLHRLHRLPRYACVLVVDPGMHVGVLRDDYSRPDHPRIVSIELNAHRLSIRYLSHVVSRLFPTVHHDDVAHRSMTRRRVVWNILRQVVAEPEQGPACVGAQVVRDGVAAQDRDDEAVPPHPQPDRCRRRHHHRTAPPSHRPAHVRRQRQQAHVHGLQGQQLQVRVRVLVCDCVHRGAAPAVETMHRFLPIIEPDSHPHTYGRASAPLAFHLAFCCCNDLSLTLFLLPTHSPPHPPHPPHVQAAEGGRV